MAFTKSQLDAMPDEARKLAMEVLDAAAQALRDESQSWMEQLGVNVLIESSGYDSDGTSFAIVRFSGDAFGDSDFDELRESHSRLDEALDAWENGCGFVPDGEK